jgi:hypothetical protein
MVPFQGLDTFCIDKNGLWPFFRYGAPLGLIIRFEQNKC